MNDVALDAFSEYGYKTAAIRQSSSVSCTNDVALVAFSECRNRTVYIPKRQRGIAYATPPPFNP